MRIVGGKHRGRPLSAPAGADTRPTTDRTREAIFNILTHSGWLDLEGARVADVFCGTGALGLEALSRGAAQVVLIDHASAAVAVARRNVETLGEAATATVLRADATRPPHAAEPCALIFLDPPYRKDLAPAALGALLARGWLGPGAIAVVEEAADAPFAPPEGMKLLDRRRYGDTTVYFLEVSGAAPDDTGEEKKWPTEAMT